TVLETLEQVKSADPVPASRLVPGTPRDLDTIALTCLQKERTKRYASAAALAEDLARFQAGEVILARGAGPIGRGWRWSRHHRAVAGLLTVLALVLVGGFSGMAVLWARAERQARVANDRAEALAREDYINRVNRAYREVDDDNVALAEDLLHGCP